MTDQIVNRYIDAGRFSTIPVAECSGIANALHSLIAVSSDDEYKRDAQLRLDALLDRMGVA